MRELIIIVAILLFASTVNAKWRTVEDDYNFIYDTKQIKKGNMRIYIITYCDNGFLYKIVDGEPLQIITSHGAPINCRRDIMTEIEDND